MSWNCELVKYTVAQKMIDYDFLLLITKTKYALRRKSYHRISVMNVSATCPVRDVTFDHMAIGNTIYQRSSFRCQTKLSLQFSKDSKYTTFCVSLCCSPKIASPKRKLVESQWYIRMHLHRSFGDLSCRRFRFQRWVHNRLIDIHTSPSKLCW
jgi:hypothetical protein